MIVLHDRLSGILGIKKELEVRARDSSARPPVGNTGHPDRAGGACT